MTGSPPAAFDPASTSLLVGTIVDNAGITRAKSVPGDRIGAAVASGIGLSPVFAVMCVDDHLTATDRYGGPAGDMRLRPDLAAAAVIDAAHRVAWAPLDQYDQDGAVMETCQRGVLKRQEAAARSAGLEFLMAYEMEFTVFTGHYSDPAHAGPGYGLRPWLQLEEFSRALLAALASAGVAVEQLHPEYGPGQLEISVAPRSPVAAADQYVLARLVIERTAQQHGLTVSFAPKTVPGAIGNGSHLHFSATREGRNVFAGGTGAHGLTPDGAALIGGLVAHLPGACGLLAPSVISYARLVPGMWAGAYACWGLENREAAVRFIRATGNPSAANTEVKCIDGASNPYLAAAAVLGMALAGLAAGLPAPAPADRDPEALGAAARERAGIHRLPGNLPEALDLLERSAVLRAALGDAVVDCLVAVRRYEVERYGQLSDDERVALLVSRY